MRPFLGAGIWLVAAVLPLGAQSVTLPAEIKVARGAWTTIAPTKVDGGAVQWRLDPGLHEVDLASLLPADLARKLKGKVVTSAVDGKYKVEAWCAKDDLASAIATAWIIVGDGKPAPVVPSVNPLPTPVNPTPPAAAAPIPDAGFRVLIVEDKLRTTPAQRNIIQSGAVRDFLKSKSVQGPKGVPEFRILDEKTDMTNDAEIWQQAMKRARTSLPWIVISNGVTGVERPLPGTLAETLILLKQVSDGTTVPSIVPAGLDIGARIAWWQQNHPQYTTKP